MKIAQFGRRNTLRAREGGYRLTIAGALGEQLWRSLWPSLHPPRWEEWFTTSRPKKGFWVIIATEKIAGTHFTNRETWLPRLDNCPCAPLSPGSRKQTSETQILLLPTLLNVQWNLPLLLVTILKAVPGISLPPPWTVPTSPCSHPTVTDGILAIKMD